LYQALRIVQVPRFMARTTTLRKGALASKPAQTAAKSADTPKLYDPLDKLEVYLSRVDILPG
jgi:hypothetical protein